MIEFPMDRDVFENAVRLIRRQCFFCGSSEIMKATPARKKLGWLCEECEDKLFVIRCRCIFNAMHSYETRDGNTKAQRACHAKSKVLRTCRAGKREI